LSSQSSNLLGKYMFVVLQLFLEVQSEADWNLNNSYIFAVVSCLVTDFLDWHFSWFLLSWSCTFRNNYDLSVTSLMNCRGQNSQSHIRNYAYLLKKIYILVDTLKWQQVPAVVVLPYV
jgi:hypothetical protein